MIKICFVVVEFWKKGWDPSDRGIECFDGEITMEYGTRAYQDRDNVVNVFCDDEADSGVIKLHTPYGLIDIDVSFDKSKQHIKLDISHHYGGNIEVTKYDGILRVRLDASLTPEQEQEMLKGYELQNDPMEIPGENRDAY